MEVIPVIDVARGEVVRGVKGDRAGYKKIVTPLAQSAEPAAVARALMGLFPFRKIYVADLDGIEGRGRNVHLVPTLSAALGQAEIWIDAGVTSPKAARAVLAAPVATLIVGSESIERVSEFTGIAAESPQRTILSLDFHADEFMGPRRLLEDPSLWPGRVIIMTLGRVGSGAGPDIARVSEAIGRAGRRKIYAAGGVRDADDLAALKAAGAAGVLVASALHSGKITAAQLRRMAGR
ncbi:MAG TPA: HisA/HisF-related TIM barrel protein [Hyphomicrobium sp.]|nr:HisA/HisF-related TIM barrel protein [Hyphomicrobium sp.]